MQELYTSVLLRIEILKRSGRLNTPVHVAERWGGQWSGLNFYINTTTETYRHLDMAHKVVSNEIKTSILFNTALKAQNIALPSPASKF